MKNSWPRFMTLTSLLLRSTRWPCLLSESLQRLQYPQPQQRLRHLRRLPITEGRSASNDADAPVCEPAVLIYIANQSENEMAAGSANFAEDPGLRRCFRELQNYKTCRMLLAVHPRSWHASTGKLSFADDFYHLHIFCDDFVLQPKYTMDSTPMTSEAEAYVFSAASKLVEWTVQGGLSQVLRSGAHINMTGNRNGKVVAGVMTGGSKEPLGAMF